MSQHQVIALTGETLYDGKSNYFCSSHRGIIGPHWVTNTSSPRCVLQLELPRNSGKSHCPDDTPLWQETWIAEGQRVVAVIDRA